MRGSHSTGSVTACATCHEAQHRPRLRLAPFRAPARSRVAVAELLVVRRLATSLVRTFDTSLPKAICLLLVFAALGAFAIYQRQIVQPRADLLATSVRNVAPADILGIRISPASYSTLVSRAIIIPPERAAEFLTLIRDAQPFQPNHPAAEWGCEMSLSTRRANFAAHISATSNNGLLIYLDGGSTLRCDPLRAFLEGVTRA